MILPLRKSVVQSYNTVQPSEILVFFNSPSLNFIDWGGGGGGCYIKLNTQQCGTQAIKTSDWFECPKKSLLKSSHPTKILATFSCPIKNPESKISTLCCLKLASNNSIIFGYVEKCFTGIVTNRYTQSTSFMYLV